MHFQSQLSMLTLGAFIMLLTHTSANDLSDENSLNSLYNNLLQREYAGPVVFRNHIVERKAQRSPSLRLRFGRRSDPDLLPQAPKKRWFGDVNQKPIRSPSLRLRFGRRSDPSVPIHSQFDILMNGQQTTDEHNNDDYNDVYRGLFDRFVRQPQRLRFGRSLPFSALPNTNDNNLETSEDGAFYDRVVRKPQRLRFGRSLPYSTLPILNINNLETSEDDGIYNRVVRKPQRLRFGRSQPFSVLPNTNDNILETSDDDGFYDRVVRKPQRLRFGRSQPFSALPNTNDNNLETTEDDEFYNRVVRKPQRLRFGRSLPFSALPIISDNNLETTEDEADDVNDVALANSEDDFYNSFMHSQKLRNLLMSLKQYDNQVNEGITTPSATSLEDEMDEFERAIRKPGPLRLRWGRSTGGRSAQLNAEEKPKNDLEQKKKLTEVSNDVDKAANHQNKD